MEKGEIKDNGHMDQHKHDYGQICDILNEEGLFYLDIEKQVLSETDKYKNEVILSQTIFFQHDEIPASLQFRRNEENNFKLQGITLRGILIDGQVITGVDTLQFEDELRSARDKYGLGRPHSWDDEPIDDYELAYALARLDDGFKLLESDGRGRPVAEKLRAKYDYGAPPDTGQYRTIQRFPFYRGFTLGHALNLYTGREVYCAVPGGRPGTKAWFKLDTANKDKAGNALLLQYGRQHNFDLKKALEALPLDENARRSVSIRSLEEGFPESVLLRLEGQRTHAWLIPDPLHGNLRVVSGWPQPGTDDLIKMPDTVAPESVGFVYAYDSQLNRMEYREHTKLEQTGQSALKNKILDWMEGDMSSVKQHGRKK